jgi:E3 Ubiquitin ligase
VSGLLTEPLFWRIALAVAIPISFFGGFRYWRRARLIADTPTSRIRSAAQGYVELNGLSRLPEGSENRSPLSHQSCAWWDYRIERKRSTGKGTTWDLIDHGISQMPFLLVDETGWCLVNPLGAEVLPRDKVTWYGSTPWPANTGSMGAVLDRMLCNYRYTEHRLPVEAPISALGEFRTQGGLQGVDMDDQAAELLRTWKQDQFGLLQQFDTNRDGVLSETEWTQARAEARKLVEARVREERPQSYHLLTKPEDGRPLLLAGCNFEALARRYRWRAALMLLAFVVLVLVLAAQLLA